MGKHAAEPVPMPEQGYGSGAFETRFAFSATPIAGSWCIRKKLSRSLLANVTFSALAQFAIEFSELANADCHDVILITAKSVPEASC